MAEKCKTCDSVLEEKIMSRTYKRKYTKLIVKNVPVYECPVCKYTLQDLDVFDKISILLETEPDEDGIYARFVEYGKEVAPEEINRLRKDPDSLII